MSRSNQEIRADEREVAWLLAQLAERAGNMTSSEFLGIWRMLEPRVLGHLRQSEAEEGGVSGSVERLRNLTWEVAVTADLSTVHCAALSRLAQLFAERVGRKTRGASLAEVGVATMGLFLIG